MNEGITFQELVKDLVKVVALRAALEEADAPPEDTRWKRLNKRINAALADVEDALLD